MHLLMYTSDYQGQPQDIPKDFRDILAKSRVNNPAKLITGALFYDQGKFIQVLEGEKETLHHLLQVLREDQRHDNIVVLMDEAIESRELSDWNMKAFDLSTTSDKDWSLLKEFRDLYLQSFKVSAKQIITWLKHFILHERRVIKH